MQARADLITVLIVGGTGFIGSAVVRQLALANVCDVIATSRTPRPSTVNLPRVRWITCDVMDPKSVRDASVGADCIINCYRDDANEAQSTKAISNILAACQANAVQKLIYLSSVAFYGAAAGEIDEWTPPLPPVHWYGRAKSFCERACRQAASPSFHVAILRPTMVYGPDGEEWFLRFMRSIKSGALDALGDNGEGFANLIYVDDLARMCAKLALSPIPEFSISIANGSERLTFNSYFDEIRNALGDQRARLAASTRLLHFVTSRSRRPARGLVKVARLASRPVLRRRLDFLFDRLSQALQPRPEDHVYNNKTYFSPVQGQALGLHAETTVRQGVAQSIETWRRHSLIKAKGIFRAF